MGSLADFEFNKAPLCDGMVLISEQVRDDFPSRFVEEELQRLLRLAQEEIAPSWDQERQIERLLALFYEEWGFGASQGVYRLSDALWLDKVLVNRQGSAVSLGAILLWIAQRLAAQGQRVMPGEEGQRALAFFADRVEGNLLAAHQEISKLALLYPAGELSVEQIEAAVLNVARYDVFKLSEAVLGGQRARVQRMLDGLQAEGEAEVLVHYALAEDIRALKRVKDAVGEGRPLPMALREQRVWGLRERLFERVLPRLTEGQLANLLYAAHQVDGIVKGLKHPGWPQEPWPALHRLAQSLCGACGGAAR